MSWLVIVAIGLATYSLRASFLLTSNGEAHPAVRGALRFVPVAVLPALAVSAVVRDGGDGVEVRVAAAVLASLVVWKTRRVVAAMATGMAVLWLLEALLRGAIL